MLHEPLTATQKLTVIQMRKPSQAEVWRALMGAVAFRPSMSKIVIAVDEDIDPENWTPCSGLWVIVHSPIATCKSFAARTWAMRPATTLAVPLTTPVCSMTN